METVAFKVLSKYDEALPKTFRVLHKPQQLVQESFKILPTSEKTYLSGQTFKTTDEINIKMAHESFVVLEDKRRQDKDIINDDSYDQDQLKLSDLILNHILGSWYQAIKRRDKRG